MLDDPTTGASPHDKAIPYTDRDPRIMALADAFVLLARGEVVAIKADRLDELERAEKTLLALQAAGVDTGAGKPVAYIVRDQHGRLHERDQYVDVRLRWRYGSTENGLWLANDDAARIGGTVSAIMTNGVDTWEDDPPAYAAGPQSTVMA